MKPARNINCIRCLKVFGTLVLTSFFLIISLSSLSIAAEKTQNPAEELFYKSIQITSRTEPVLDMAVSLDGRYIVYISGDEKPTNLWLASADPDVIMLPEKLVDGVSVKSSPAISADGRYVAYVDTKNDVKGDIYVIDLKDDEKKPVRLTDRDTEDGGPCFSSDGRFLYFHQTKGNRPRDLAVIDLAKNGNVLPIKTGGDAMFCSLSPDNLKLAFVSTRADVSGDIFIFNTSNQTIRQVTGGPTIDMFPQWAQDSNTLYFSRIGSDTNHDQELSTEDHSVICRIQTDGAQLIPFPVTPLNQVSFKPFKANKRIYFLSNQAGVSNCWSVPEQGYIRTAKSSTEQLLIADKIADRIPYDPYKTLLAYVRVIENFPDDAKVCAKAGYAAAGIFQDLNLMTSALGGHQFVARSFKGILPEAILSEIKIVRIEFLKLLQSATRASEKQNILKKSLTRLDFIAQQHPGIIAAEARLESVKTLLESDSGLSEMSEALNRLDKVVKNSGAQNSQKAQALFLQSEIYTKTATGSQVIDTLRNIIVNYPKERKWVDKAVDRIIDQIMTSFAFKGRDEKIQKLNLAAIKYQLTAPPFAMGALNRIGDLYYESDELDQAKNAYENVLDTYPVLTTQTAAARLSLAEILFREEHFREAIELYEEEINLRDSSDRIYQLARQGYIRKNVAAGEFLFRLGEIPSARSRFKELIDYDDRIIEAHRGYIKCAAVSGTIESVLDTYRKKLNSASDDPVWLYCNGLCLTYLNDFDSAKEAGKLIEKSIRYNNSIEYFHQTLGYVYEVLETVYGESRQLEYALMSYQKAYFLNDHIKNAENAANLELNIGNIYYLMGQYKKAFDFYTLRDQRDIEFSDPNTRIVFFKRFGECAFQNDDIAETITAFTRAIELIDSHIDPQAASRAFDKLNNYIKERIIDPAVNIEKTKDPAEKIASRQSEQALKVSDLTSTASSPPSSKWRSYKEKMGMLIEDQEKLNKSAFKLAEKYNYAIEDIPGSLLVVNARQNLSSLTQQIQQALDFPERLIELKAEISDRLGLAYQENGEWEKAAETFEQVFSINQKMEKFVNLARNRRSVAYNNYQLANSVTGDLHNQMLKKASDDFKQVLSLIEQYGVPAPAEKAKQALVEISVSTSLDATSATQAAKGFSESQEKRLAETFISRIQLELGNLELSRRELEKQLKDYPSPEKVNKKDLYGVSLLYHRAGLLENGVGNFTGAFEKFSFSAQLCLKLKNPMSAMLNITNMVSAGQESLKDKSGIRLSSEQIKLLQNLDKQTEDLLSEKTDINSTSTLIDYHNRLGIFYFNAADSFKEPQASQASQASIEDAVFQLFIQQHAVSHFTKGVTLFEKNISFFRRKQFETGTRLYLNMAAVSRVLGNEESAMMNYQSALKYSDIGIFPELKWRALAGLNKPGQAFNVLQNVPLSRAGCAPMEIIDSLGSLVFEELKGNDNDAALNLVEKLSELERFNRMAPYIRPQNRNEKLFFAKLYPKLEQIQTLRKELVSADKDRQPFVEQRLKNENILLAKHLGPDHENLPLQFKTIGNKETQDIAVLLASLDQIIEKTADKLAEINIRLLDENNNNEKNQNRAEELRLSYQNLIARYQELAEDAYYDRPLTAAPDFITLMHAEPFDVEDLVEVLTDDDAVARIFHTSAKESFYAVFLITKDETTAFITDDKDLLIKKINDTIDWITPYIAYENPLSLNFDISYPYALSAKHLQRCINSRKPFKQNLIAIPNIPLPKQVSENYDIQNYDTKNTDNVFETDNLLKDLSSAISSSISSSISGANTLIVANGPLAAATVPTEPGDMSRRFLAVYTDNEQRIRLEKLLAGSTNLSLSILKSGNPNQLYLTGHLFSIYGCPGVIFVNNPKDHMPSVSAILASYSDMSGIDALQSGADSLTTPTGNNQSNIQPARIQPHEIQTDQLLYLGYQGMTKKESAKFAKKNFAKYVKSGRSEFDRKNFVTATVMFENAIAVANEISKYDKYLPDLYKYARESAYLSGGLDQSLSFANELADLMADIKPDSKGHAESLLRLGLMYSKKENYEKAIPVIKNAVSIMSQLPPDEDLVHAFTDLGIVLENATNYDSALSRFKHAAELSRTLNQSELMGEQYLNIGRVYDLRLNQYAAAIKNYEQALKLFTESEDFEKIAESKLNIGRCYRLLGNFSEADRYYDQSLSMIESKAPDQLMVKVKVLIEQANNAWFQGRYEEAFKQQRECYRIAKEQQFSLMQVISLNTEGLIWWTLGDYDKAIEALNNALTDAKSLKIRQDEVATTLNNMGLIYRDKKEYEKALTTFDQAISIDTAIGSKWGLAYDYRNKGLTFLKLDQPKKAALLFDQAYEISTAIGNRINAAKAILGKGDALLALKEYQAAQKAYQTALELSESMMIKETQWRSLFGLAKIQIIFTNDPETNNPEANNLDAAETLLRESIEVIEHLRSNIKIKQLKENFIANKLSVYETLVKLLADKHMPEQSFEIAERSRARNFIDLLGGQQIGFATDEDNKLYHKQQIIKSEIETTELLVGLSSEVSEREIYKKSLKNLQHDLQNIIIEMQLQNPQLASMVSVPPVDTDQLIRFMEPGTALLSYYLLENEVFCWILRSDVIAPEKQLQLIRIPADRETLEKQILAYRRIIQNLEPYEKHAGGLYATLFEPLHKHLKGIHTIGISPHGSLHYLSFATLYNGKSFLLNDYSMFYVPSAAVLEYTLNRRTARPYRSPKVLAVGNPDLGDPILDLPFAEQEVGAIRWDFPDVEVLTRKNATKKWVIDNISDFDVIHIASHGEFDPVNPLLSAIKLASPADKNFTKSDFDGNLNAGEIFGLKINADLVFLSACQTGLGKINAGDDVVGLNRSFFYAGTHTVISSLWRVSDVSTAVMIKTFYRLYMNQNKADCLRQAAIHVKTRYPHPGYWGAFTLVGDYY